MTIASLRQIYQQQDILTRQWKQRGGKVVGYISADVPEELIIAADMLPVRLIGNPSSRPQHAEKYLRGTFHPSSKHIFDRILDFSYDFLDGLIFSNLDESVVRIFYFVREIQRLETNPAIPPYHYFEMLHQKSSHYRNYNFARIDDLMAKLKIWSGKPIMEKALIDAITVCNENRDLLAKVAELRLSGTLSGVDALQIIGTSMTMHKTQHNGLLKSLLDGFKQSERIADQDKIRVFVVGSSLDNTQLYELIESSGAIVVAEDSDWGNRRFEGQVNATLSPIESIADYYTTHAPYPSKSTIDERVDYLVSKIEQARPDAVIFFMYHGEQPLLWDYPEQRRALQARNIPSLCLSSQPYDLSEHADLKSEIAKFFHSLERSAQPHA